jgi:hypothetical protein
VYPFYYIQFFNTPYFYIVEQNWHDTFIKEDQHDIEWKVETSPFLNYGKHCSIGFAS